MNLSKRRVIIFLGTLAFCYFVLLFLPFNFNYDQSIFLLFGPTFVINQITNNRFYLIDIISFLYIFILIGMIFSYSFSKKIIFRILSIFGFCLAVMEIIFYFIIINRTPGSNIDYYDNISKGYNEQVLIAYTFNIMIFVFLFNFSFRNELKDLLVFLTIFSIFMVCLPSLNEIIDYKVPVDSSASQEPSRIFGVYYIPNYLFIGYSLSTILLLVFTLLKKDKFIKILLIIFVLFSLGIFIYTIYKSHIFNFQSGTKDLYTRSQIFYGLVLFLISIDIIFYYFKKEPSSEK